MEFFSISFLKRFFEPLKNNNIFLFIVRNLFFWVQWAILAYMMKYWVDSVSSWNEKWLIIAVIIIWCVTLLSLGPNYYFRKLKQRLLKWIQKEFYIKYLTRYFKLNNNYADYKWTWFFNSALQRGLDNRSTLLIDSLTIWLVLILRLITAIILIIWHIGILWWILVFILFIISFIVTQYWWKKLKPIRKDIREYTSFADNSIIRLIMSKFEVLGNWKITIELKKLEKIIDDILFKRYKEWFIQIYTYDIQRWIIHVVQLSLLLYAGYWVINWEFQIWLLSMIRMLLNQINGSITDLSWFIDSFNSRIIYVEKLRETFDDAPLIQWYDEGKDFLYKRWDIVLDTITYDYGKWEVLKDFSLHIQWGKKTALVGISGSGKSTLIKLIAGYIHPQSGTIVVDKQKLPNGQNDDFVSLESYYQHIGYLTQEPNVFDGTIYENLTYALDNDHKPTQSSLDREVRRIIKLAQCEFIYNFPDGLQTHIWEKGIKLSWWQRQRLAIAKIMLKNPQIILLDEPTSALDSFSEEEVTKALENLFVWKTVIVIAHRLQTVKKADEIIVLEWWKVVEHWSHNQLVELWWQYAKMLELQSGF